MSDLPSHSADSPENNSAPALDAAHTEPSLPSEQTPLPLTQALRQLPTLFLKALRTGDTHFFSEEQSKAAWNIIWAQLIILSVISALLALLFNHSAANMVTAFLLSLLVTLAVTGGSYLLAKVFGGQGPFPAHAYCFLLFFIPLDLLSQLISFFRNTILSSNLTTSLFFLALYLVIFVVLFLRQYAMTRAVHQLSPMKATLVTLLSWIFWLALSWFITSVPL